MSSDSIIRHVIIARDTDSLPQHLIIIKSCFMDVCIVSENDKIPVVNTVRIYKHLG
jgi:hypothetical protein